MTIDKRSPGGRVASFVPDEFLSEEARQERRTEQLERSAQQAAREAPSLRTLAYAGLLRAIAEQRVPIRSQDLADILKVLSAPSPEAGSPEQNGEAEFLASILTASGGRP